MYAVEVSDHIMIAHSFKGEVFGPAQALHGATFTVAVAFMSEKLDGNGIVVDIGCAIDVLKATLKTVNYKNLDDMAEFAANCPEVPILVNHCGGPLGIGPYAGRRAEVDRVDLYSFLQMAFSRGLIAQRAIGLAQVCFLR